MGVSMLWCHQVTMQKRLIVWRLILLIFLLPTIVLSFRAHTSWIEPNNVWVSPLSHNYFSPHSCTTSTNGLPIHHKVNGAGKASLSHDFSAKFTTFVCLPWTLTSPPCLGSTRLGRQLRQAEQLLSHLIHFVARNGMSAWRHISFLRIWIKRLETLHNK